MSGYHMAFRFRDTRNLMPQLKVNISTKQRCNCSQSVVQWTIMIRLEIKDLSSGSLVPNCSVYSWRGGRGHDLAVQV